jgi:hypothetical protein
MSARAFSSKLGCPRGGEMNALPGDGHKNDLAAWIDNLAFHSEAADKIAASGASAIPALRDYLRGDPRVIPHARCFAVAMLARVQSADAIAILRDVLSRNRLRDLKPVYREAEYVVKNDVVHALAQRAYPELGQDIVSGISERLPAAIQEAARLCLVDLAPKIAHLLDDDVLAEPAGEALVDLAHVESASGVRVALVAQLQTWLRQSATSLRSRIGAMRMLAVLARTGIFHRDRPFIERGLTDPHPLIQSAAALVLWRLQGDQDLADLLVRGVLAHDRWLSSACTDELLKLTFPIARWTLPALHRRAEPDIYGLLHRPPTERCRRLIMVMLEKATDSASSMRDALACESFLLIDAIAHGPAPSPELAKALLEVDDVSVREAARRILSRPRYPTA